MSSEVRHLITQMAYENFLRARAAFTASFSCSGSQSRKLPCRVICLPQEEAKRSRCRAFFAIKPVRSASIPSGAREDMSALTTNPVGLHLSDPRQRKIVMMRVGLRSVFGRQQAALNYPSPTLS